jgi:hypothetical protein
METSIQDINILIAIKSPADITSVELVDMFIDDHACCAEAKINGAYAFFGWYDEISLGFLKYWKDSPTARQDLFESLKTVTRNAITDLEEDGAVELSAEMNEWLKTH